MIRTLMFAVFIAVPIAEIALFLTVGSAIGVLPTLAIIVATAVLGVVLLKRQGLSAIQRLQSDARQGRVPAAAIGHAITIAIAGVLLLTPGFMTDAMGFLLFVPAVRRALWRQIAGSVQLRAGPFGRDPSAGPPPGGDGPGFHNPGTGRRGPVIDLEASDGPRERDPNSPWSDRKG